MASFRNPRMLQLVAGLLAAGPLVKSDEPAKPVTSEKSSAAPVEPAKEKERLELPIPKGQPQKGLRIPIHTPEGKLIMDFQIGVAEVVDADNIKMGDLRLETFKEDGEREFDIDLPDSIFNAKTKELSSKVRVVVKRRDFEISGNSMIFNVETKAGTFGNGVKMIIYDARAVVGEDADEKPAVPSIEVKPPQEEKK